MVGRVEPGYIFQSREQATEDKVRALWEVVPGIGAGATFLDFDQSNLVAGAGLCVVSLSAPSDTDAIWFDQNLSLVRIYDGTDWQPLNRGIVLTNKSGSPVVKGDVVVVDTANDSAFTSTTTVNHSRVIGVAAEAIANNAKGVIITFGEATVNLSTSAPSSSAGVLIGTSGTAFKSVASTTASAGQFGILSGFPGTSLSVQAYLFGQPAL